MEVFNLGVTLILLGSALGGLAYLWLRVIPSRIGPARLNLRPEVPLDLPDHGEAVLLVRSGGRISFANCAAQDLFGLAGEEPDLEQLSRRIQPDHAFLALCAVAGQASFSLEGSFLEGKSFSLLSAGEPAVLVTLRRVPPAEDPSTAGAVNASTALSEKARLEDLRILTETSQILAANLQPDELIPALLVHLKSLLTYDTGTL